MKEALREKMEAVGDTTSGLGRSLKKSLQGYTKEVRRFTSSLGGIFDMEDWIKSIHRCVHKFINYKD